jgi:uncharacterized peroxidase-related enzyme
MTPAIKPVDPAANEFLAGLESKSKKPNPFFRAMAHHPKALETFVPFYGAVVAPGSVDRRIKELVYLACSYVNECAFCTSTHVSSGRRAGIQEEELKALRTEQDHSFTEPERAAIQYARELTQTAAGDDTRDTLLQHFNDQQVVEITLVAAMANFTNRFNNALAIFPED